MTDQEIQIERRHIMETRLGILGVLATDKPTALQLKIATDEADEWEQKIRLEMWSRKQQRKEKK